MADMRPIDDFLPELKSLRPTVAWLDDETGEIVDVHVQALVLDIVVGDTIWRYDVVELIQSGQARSGAPVGAFVDADLCRGCLPLPTVLSDGSISRVGPRVHVGRSLQAALSELVTYRWNVSP